jgi:hypothetical protein
MDTVYKVASAGVQDPFWIKGSHYHGREWDVHMTNVAWVTTELNVWGSHINGAALYTLQDPEFAQFIADTQRHFPPKLGGLIAYDFTIQKEHAIRSCGPGTYERKVHDPDTVVQCLAWRQKTASLFQHSKYIQMLGTSLMHRDTVERVLRRDRTTVLVHGKPDGGAAGDDQNSPRDTEKVVTLD